MLQTLNHLYGLHWTLYSNSLSFLNLEPMTEHSTPDLASPGQGREAGSPPYLVGHTLPDAFQDLTGPPGPQDTLSAHVQLAIHQHPKVLLHRVGLL